MPIPGPQPAPARRRANKLSHEWIEVEDVPYGGPKPELRRTRQWPEETVAWWDVISAMPHCILWSDSDWRFALEAAELHAQFYEGKGAGLSTEIRQREKVMGTTVDYRMALRIRYVEPAEADEAGPTAIEEYRKRLQSQ